jgi:hypothetical protein
MRKTLTIIIFTPNIKGITVVVAAAACADWVIPMNARDITMVAGIPAIAPPIFEPRRSEKRLRAVIQILPTTKDSAALIVNGSALLTISSIFISVFSHN